VVAPPPYGGVTVISYGLRLPPPIVPPLVPELPPKEERN
jgi:hypothetical protein